MLENGVPKSIKHRSYARLLVDHSGQRRLLQVGLRPGTCACAATCSAIALLGGHLLLLGVLDLCLASAALALRFAFGAMLHRR